MTTTAEFLFRRAKNWPCMTRDKPNFLSGIKIILFKKFTLFAVYYHMIMKYVVHHLSCHSIYTLCWTNLLYQKNSKTRTGKIITVIVLKIKQIGLTLHACTQWQTVKTLIRLLFRSSLIWVYTVCPDLS